MLIIIAISASAQKNKDVLYLKNGSIIYGNLQEISNNQVKLMSNDGSFFIYPLQEVDKLEKGEPTFEGRKEKGFGMTTEAGLMVGPQGSDYVAPFSFNILGNYTLAKRHILSIGSGIEFIGNAYMPIFAGYKYLLRDKRSTPFFFARVGNLFHMPDNYNNEDSYTSYRKHDFRGGFSFTAGTGFEWTKDDISTFISFAYRYARTSYRENNYPIYSDYYYPGDYDYKYINNYHRLEIKFGFRF